MSNSETFIKQLPTKLEALKTILDGGLTISSSDLSTVATNTTDISSDTSYVAACVDTGNDRLKVDVNNLSGNAVDLKTDLDHINSCVEDVTDMMHAIKIDNSYIQSEATSVNSGSKDAGCQRICIATDDINSAAINTAVTNIPNVVKIHDGQSYAQGSNNRGFSIAVCRNEALATRASFDDNYCVLSSDRYGRILANVDQTKINGTTIDTNSGNLSAGTQRVCIASTDIPTKPLVNCQVDIASLKQFAICTRDSASLSKCPVGVGLARQDYVSSSGNNVFVACGSGNISAAPTYTNDSADNYGCPRVCIATDDVNLSDIKSKIDSIYTILNDVWDSTNHYLKTHAV